MAASNLDRFFGPLLKSEQKSGNLPVDGYASKEFLENKRHSSWAARRIIQAPPQERRIGRPPPPIYPSMGMPPSNQFVGPLVE